MRFLRGLLGFFAYSMVHIPLFFLMLFAMATRLVVRSFYGFGKVTLAVFEGLTPFEFIFSGIGMLAVIGIGTAIAVAGAVILGALEFVAELAYLIWSPIKGAIRGWEYGVGEAWDACMEELPGFERLFSLGPEFGQPWSSYYYQAAFRGQELTAENRDLLRGLDLETMASLKQFVREPRYVSARLQFAQNNQTIFTETTLRMANIANPTPQQRSDCDASIREELERLISTYEGLQQIYHQNTCPILEARPAIADSVIVVQQYRINGSYRACPGAAWVYDRSRLQAWHRTLESHGINKKHPHKQDSWDTPPDYRGYSTRYQQYNCAVVRVNDVDITVTPDLSNIAGYLDILKRAMQTYHDQRREGDVEPNNFSDEDYDLLNALDPQVTRLRQCVASGNEDGLFQFARANPQFFLPSGRDSIEQIKIQINHWITTYERLKSIYQDPEVECIISREKPAAENAVIVVKQFEVTPNFYQTCPGSVWLYDRNSLATWRQRNDTPPHTNHGDSFINPAATANGCPTRYMIYNCEIAQINRQAMTLTPALIDTARRLKALGDKLPIRNHAQGSGIYSQQLGFRLGANEQAEGVYMEYMTEGARVCNNAEHSSAKSIAEQSIFPRDSEEHVSIEPNGQYAESTRRAMT